MIARAADSKESTQIEVPLDLTGGDKLQEDPPEAEQFGPKTAELPDTTTYSSCKMQYFTPPPHVLISVRIADQC